MIKKILPLGTYATVVAASQGPREYLSLMAAKHATQADLLNLINNLARFVAAGVGGVIVLNMAWKGFQYLTAGDNAGQVAEAKKGMRDVVIALFLYIFGLALLNFLMPGGLF